MATTSNTSSKAPVKPAAKTTTKAPVRSAAKPATKAPVAKAPAAKAPAAPKAEKPAAPNRYTLLTGIDDSAFCARVSAKLDEGYELYGSPSITFNGKNNIVAQAVILKKLPKKSKKK
ncbi:MAG: DUF1737 domain-containing protein [Micrococcales bacterium]